MFDLWMLAGITTFLFCLFQEPCLRWLEDLEQDLEQHVQQMTVRCFVPKTNKSTHTYGSEPKERSIFLLNRRGAPKLASFPTVERPSPCDNGHTIQEFRVVEASGSIQPADIVSRSASHSDLLKATMAASRHSDYLPEERVPPVCRLPPEILMAVLEIAVKSNGHSPLDMMHICHYWRVIVFDLACIWSGLTIQPCISREYVEFLMERSRRVPLEVEINWNKGLGDGQRTHEGMDLAMRSTSRWRTLTLAGSPTQLDIGMVTEEDNSATTLTMSQLQALKVTRGYGVIIPFTQLLRAVATTSTSRLVHVEIASLDALLFLANPGYRDLFSRLKHFKVDVRGMTDPVDILPYFENLEVLEAYGLQLPTYEDDVYLPIVRTLKRMDLRRVPAQWMSGRTFPVLEESQVTWAHCSDVCWSSVVQFPKCTQFTYDDRSIKEISKFHLPQLDRMILRNESWNKRRGSTQLSSVWGQSADSIWLRPRVLHLDVYCYDHDLINALRLHPSLEELVLGLVRPYALGKKFFSAMMAKRPEGRPSSLGSASGLAQPDGMFTNLLVATLVPSLKLFGVRYGRWNRETERDDVIPLLNGIIHSREKTVVPLQSVKFWPTKDTPEEDAVELVSPRG